MCWLAERGELHLNKSYLYYLSLLLKNLYYLKRRNMFRIPPGAFRSPISSNPRTPTWGPRSICLTNRCKQHLRSTSRSTVPAAPTTVSLLSSCSIGASVRHADATHLLSPLHPRRRARTRPHHPWRHQPVSYFLFPQPQIGSLRPNPHKSDASVP
jgi:hypothetical protein